MQSLSTWVLALLSVCLTAAAQILLKAGVATADLQATLTSGSVRNFLLQAPLSPCVLLGLTAYILSAMIWLIVLARADLSFAYPFVGLSMIATTSYGFWVLQEPVGPARLTGIALIVVGVVLVARS